MLFPQKHTGADTTIFSVMSALAAEYGAVNLSQGFPDYPIDTRIQEFLAEATVQGFNQYAPMPGLPLLTEQIALQKNKQLNVAIDAGHITICPGASYGIFVALAALLNKGEEVIILEPAYDAYIPAIEINGGIPVPVPLNYPDFSVDWDRLRAAVTTRTRAIIVNTPHNPTGVTWSAPDWQQLADLVAGKDILVISDEVYDQIVFDGQQHHSVLQQEALQEQCVAVFSFGKQFHATGWKIGYTIACPAITKAIRKVHQFIAFSVNTPAQYALGRFMQQFPGEDSCALLNGKRDLLHRLLADTPLKIIAPAAGSYFQVADYSAWKDMPDTAFAQWLTKEAGVATIPLSAFYKDGTDNKLVRFCFAKEDKTLQIAIEKIKAKL
ncbi:MAG: hypothetical protein BGO31_08890 [Bacteroidetes bacterium 43-16]|nr:MAG: hypothetical protein BGO31_08890 [Bacteroidetes bacterium 43-16]